MKNWMLVCCYERDIETPKFFDTKEEAVKAMCADVADVLGMTPDEVMEVRANKNGISVSLNAITECIFLRAQSEINAALDERIDDLKGYEVDGIIDEDELKELEAIKELNPEEDISWYCNCLDTGIYIINDKYDVHKEYFGDLLDELENKMGFEFGY